MPANPVTASPAPASQSAPPQSAPASESEFDPFQESLEQTLSGEPQRASANVAGGAATAMSSATAMPGGAIPATVCPSCGQAVGANAVICLGCGTNIKSGKVTKTKVRKAKQTGKAQAAYGEPLRHEKGLLLTGIGLACHFLGIVLGPVALIVLSFMMGLAVAVASNGGSGAGGAISGGVALGFLLITLLMVGLVMLGPLLGLAAPSAEARNLLMSAIVLFVLTIPVGAGVAILLHPVLGTLVILLMVITAVRCVLGFLETLSAYIYRPTLERFAGILKKMFTVQIMLLVLVNILTLFAALAERAGSTNSSGLAFMIMCVLGLMGVLSVLLNIGYLSVVGTLACTLLFGHSVGTRKLPLAGRSDPGTLCRSYRPAAMTLCSYCL